MEELEEERLAVRTEATQSADSVTFPPAECRIPLFYLTRDHLPLAILVNFLHGHFSFKQVDIPLLHRHMCWVQWRVIINFSNDVEETLAVVRGETWVW